jgi:hypothetical protein
MNFFTLHDELHKETLLLNVKRKALYLGQEVLEISNNGDQVRIQSNLLL